MKRLSIGRITLYISILLTVVFIGGRISDAMDYAKATDSIKKGDYASAVVTLEKLEGYQDAEILKAYCEIMNEYDATDFVSIYHCYRGLTNIENLLDNTDLSEEFTKTTTEVETLYKYYNVTLSAK